MILFIVMHEAPPPPFEYTYLSFHTGHELIQSHNVPDLLTLVPYGAQIVRGRGEAVVSVRVVERPELQSVFGWSSSSIRCFVEVVL